MRAPSSPRSTAWVVAVALTVAAACASGPGDSASTGGAPPTTAAATEDAEAARASSTEALPPSTEAPTTTTTTEASPPSTEAPTTTTAPGPPPLAEEVGSLQPGSRGTRTLALQEALGRLGFDVGEPDGAYGTKTTQAVWAYQALQGLPKDGIVTPELEARIAEGAPLTMLRPDLGPTHTEVDLDKQVLLVWGDGQLELVTHVSTGSGISYCETGSGPNATPGATYCGSATTPEGDYRYERRIEGERHAPLGVLYSPVYFNGGIAVHGAPSVPNHPASHGCVRIPLHISSYFQTLVADGEPISVFRGGAGPAAPVAPTGQPAAPAPAGAENGG